MKPREQVGSRPIRYKRMMTVSKFSLHKSNAPLPSIKIRFGQVRGTVILHSTSFCISNFIRLESVMEKNSLSVGCFPAIPNQINKFDMIFFV
jgi:hypothetical protein